MDKSRKRRSEFVDDDCTFRWLFKPKKNPTEELFNFMKRRYPRLSDAIEGLEKDNTLTAVQYFAALPLGECEEIKDWQIKMCRRLTLEWHAYISFNHALRKVFIHSEKGFFYQADVEETTVTWILPPLVTTMLPEDKSEIRTKLVFLNFHMFFLGHVISSLYKRMNLQYNDLPETDLEVYSAGLCKLLSYISDKLKHSKTLDEEQEEYCNLFRDMKLFLSDKVQFQFPLERLVLVILSFGGTVSWQGEGAPFPESDPTITHEIIHIFETQEDFSSRKYVQAEWIFDCANSCIILPTDDYKAGREAPPHLSPFVYNYEANPVSEHAKFIRKLQVEAGKEHILWPGPDDNFFSDMGPKEKEPEESAEEERQREINDKNWHQLIKMELEQHWDELKMEFEIFRHYHPPSNVRKQKDAKGTEGDEIGKEARVELLKGKEKIDEAEKSG